MDNTQPRAVVSFRLSEQELETLDLIVEQLELANRTQALRYALMFWMKNNNLE